MKILNLIIAAWLLSASLASNAFAVEESPDALIKRLSQEIVQTAKEDKEIQSGDKKRIFEFAESKVIPVLDFKRMTSLAVGKNWRDATTDQQAQLISEFRTLLIYTYSGAISQIKDQRIELKPSRADPVDTEVEVKSLVIRPRDEPLQLNYRLEKLPEGWKIYDINVMGVWLVETYKGNFATEVGRSGIDGLIKTLTEKNRKLASVSSGKLIK